MADIQLEFDFGEIQGFPPKRKKPKLHLLHFAKPKCDNERLLNFQWEFRVHGRKDSLDRMYLHGRTVALKFINVKANGNRHLTKLSMEEREEKAHNAITYIIARYMQDEDFYIEKSFTAYLYLRVLHELFYRRKVDKIVQFLDMGKLRGMRNEVIKY